MKNSLISFVKEKTENAFKSTLNIKDVEIDVTESNRPDLGQFQCNSAMKYGKITKSNPKELAEKICINLIHCVDEDGTSIFRDIFIAGPGFINITLSDKFLSNFVMKSTNELEKIGHGKTVVLDFGGPNMAKAMHVGHLRSSIIGDSLRRLYEEFGYKTISDAHLGDWGLPMGMLLVGLEMKKIKDSEITLPILEKLYPKMALLCKEDEDIRQKAREYTALLQSKAQPFYKTWEIMRKVSLEMIQENFNRLNVKFDHYFGESNSQDGLKSLKTKLESKKIIERSNGALIIHVEKDSDKKPMPPFMFENRDGGATYGATDLETIETRVNELKADEILYVVDQRQHLHFEQLFRAYKKYKPQCNSQIKHIGFGTLNGPDNKPFKTRDGGVMRLEMLLDMVYEKALQKINESSKEFSNDEKSQIANCIMLATLKFADLSTPRMSDYIFDLEKFSSFQGFTGPYLIYTAVRINALLKKANKEDLEISKPYEIKSVEERNLMLQITKLHDVAIKSIKDSSPHILCQYAFDLAQSFSILYTNHKILSENDDTRRKNLLQLSIKTKSMLEKVLNILGISVPEKM